MAGAVQTTPFNVPTAGGRVAAEVTKIDPALERHVALRSRDAVPARGE